MKKWYCQIRKITRLSLGKHKFLSSSQANAPFRKDKWLFINWRNGSLVAIVVLYDLGLYLHQMDTNPDLSDSVSTWN